MGPIWSATSSDAGSALQKQRKHKTSQEQAELFDMYHRWKSAAGVPPFQDKWS